MKSKIGFMQGRFSSVVNNRIQSFPWDSWREEFKLAKRHGFQMMEWVIENERLSDNPLMNEEGRKDIKQLMDEYQVSIPSITCDTFIQEPFYKASGAREKQLLNEFKQIIEACAQIGISTIVVPLVDLGSLENEQQEMSLGKGLDFVFSVLKAKNLTIAFESDFSPKELKSFIGKFEATNFGVNYDIGNSASLGYDFNEEIALYGERILNVHVKDRPLHGTTVPLGEGNADLPGALRALKNSGYKGNYMLQTARDPKGSHDLVLCKYRDMITPWLN